MSPAAAPDAGVGEQSTGPVPASETQPLADSACMAKTDLREFTTVQLGAVTGILALNIGQKDERGRASYRWPTRSLGSQVGSSLTKIDSQVIVSGQQNSCSSAFRPSKSYNKKP